MERKIIPLALLVLVIASSGCTSLEDATGSGCDEGCPDACSDGTRLHGGWCVLGECKYSYETCAQGCSDGECLPEPHGLALSDNPQQKSGFRLEITSAEVADAGKNKNDEPVDDYLFTVSVTKTSGEGGIFSVNGASIVSGTGLMHSTVGFGWSELVKTGETKGISFRIEEVPAGLRGHNTTVIIRTNQGHYYYGASFLRTEAA